MELLDRLVGTWDVEMSSKARPGQKLKAEITGRKILGGRYIEIRDRQVPTGDENYTLITYDAEKKAYRQWHYSSRWGHTEGTGAWDEATKTLSWTGQGGTTKTPVNTSLVWKLGTSGNTEFKNSVRDRKDKVLEDLEGTQTRRSAKK